MNEEVEYHKIRKIKVKINPFRATRHDSHIQNDLYIYLGHLPQSGGVADNTKETTKTNGGFTPFF